MQTYRQLQKTPYGKCNNYGEQNRVFGLREYINHNVIRYVSAFHQNLGFTKRLFILFFLRSKEWPFRKKRVSKLYTTVTVHHFYKSIITLYEYLRRNINCRTQIAIRLLFCVVAGSTLILDQHCRAYKTLIKLDRRKLIFESNVKCNSSFV